MALKKTGTGAVLPVCVCDVSAGEYFCEGCMCVRYWVYEWVCDCDRMWNVVCVRGCVLMLCVRV